MNRVSQFIHDNQIVIAALILLIAVLVYCLFNRYQPMRFRDASVVIDRLTGKCYSPYGGELERPKYTIHSIPPATPATSR